MEAIYSSEMSFHFQMTTRRHITEDSASNPTSIYCLMIFMLLIGTRGRMGYGVNLSDLQVCNVGMLGIIHRRDFY
jgi:hypothetical protein